MMQAKSLSSFFIELMHLFGEAWKRYRTRRAALYELSYCDASELARVAQDLGITADDLRLLASRDKTAADLLRRRLETLRIDPRVIDPALMRDLQRCCSNCESKPLCAHELEDNPIGATWPQYCPNEETIAVLSQPSQNTSNSPTNTSAGANQPLK
jgi:hypothetical protein